MGMEIRQHLEDQRRRLTPLQMEGLSNAASAIHKYFLSWETHALAHSDTTLFSVSTTSTRAGRAKRRGTAHRSRKNHLKAV